MNQANQRAQMLLLSFLDERQQKQVTKHGWFEMIGSDGFKYRIDCTAYSGNVLEYRDDDVAYRRHCCYPDYYRLRQKVPLADVILGQFLALRTDAPRFKRIAL